MINKISYQFSYFDEWHDNEIQQNWYSTNIDETTVTCNYNYPGRIKQNKM